MKPNMTTLLMIFLFLGTASIAADQCSFLWTGKDFFPPEKHGGPECYQCLTCGYEEGEVCCPACVKNCHVGHELLPQMPEVYFCDCGAGTVASQKTCCQIMPKSALRQIAESGFKLALSTETSLAIFKDLLDVEKSSTLSVVGLYELCRASGAMQGKNSFAPLITSSLEMKAFQFGQNFQGPGIKTAPSITALNSLIETETSFKDLLSNGTAKALVVIAISNEKFLKPFNEKYTEQNYACFNSKGEQKSCTMMQSLGEPNAKAFYDYNFLAARLAYEGGGSLLLLMGNPDTKKIISDFSASELHQAISNLIADGHQKVLVNLPKGMWVTKPASIRNTVTKYLPEAAEYFADYDDVLQAATFMTTEKGTVAKSVTAAISRGGPSVLTFNHPFIAIISDDKNQPLFISYISFNE